MKMLNVKLISLLTAMLLLLPVVACSDDPDGVWDPMKWKVENATSGISVADNNITLTGEAGSLDLVCTNYTSFWIEGIRISDGEYLPIIPENNQTVAGEWYNITISGNTMHISLTNASTGSVDTADDSITLTVSAGDAFSAFTISHK